MAGLYTKRNLGEEQLNLLDAVQKLYNTGIERDITLFAFSGGLFSDISSATQQPTGTAIPNQVYGMKNVPLFDGTTTSLRTKFITNNFTFSSENNVYFDFIDSSSFDKRQSTETAGAEIYVSKNGSLVKVELVGEGKKYKIKNSDGSAVSSNQSIDVNVRGIKSNASSAIVRLTLLSSGSFSKIISPKVISGGSGYLEDEGLEIITQCQVNRYGEQETPETTKCKNYDSSLPRLYYTSYDTTDKSLGSKVVLKSLPYTYITKFADEGGFFLYDSIGQKWVYLGAYYDELRVITSSSSPRLIFKRKDTVTSKNLLNLYKLDSSSHFFSYVDGFVISGDGAEKSISGQIKSLTGSVQKIKNNFEYLFQNVKRQRIETDSKNELGTQFNIFQGANINSSFRMVMRDPDGVLDRSDVTFSDLRDSLKFADQVELTVGAAGATPTASYHAPGIWINVGDRYQRAFSTDDKPFLSSKGRNFISPLIHKLSSGSTEVYEPRSDTGENKYSISTAYLKPEATTVQGFDTKISVLVQNLSSNASNGGIVYYPAITSTTINLSQGITGWPLFKYRFNAVEYTPAVLGFI